jgi:AcrR family transcriptional regulator
VPTAPTTPRRRLQPADRRAEIVEAATRLIAERGYRGLTVQGVAEACGLTVAGVLHHMGTKDGILVAVLEHRDVVDVEAAKQLTHGAAGPREHLDAIMARNAAQPEIVRLYSVLGAESLDPGHPAHAYFRRRYARSRAELAELLAGSVDDPEGAAVQVLAAMDGLQLQWLRSPETFDLPAAWAVAADAILSRRRRPLTRHP